MNEDLLVVPSEKSTIELYPPHRYIITAEKAHTSPEIAAMQQVYDLPEIYKQWAVSHSKDTPQSLLESGKWIQLAAECQELHGMRQILGNIRSTVESGLTSDAELLLEELSVKRRVFLERTQLPWPPQLAGVSTVNGSDMDIIVKKDTIGTLFHDLDGKVGVVMGYGTMMQSYPDLVSEEYIGGMLGGLNEIPQVVQECLEMVSQGIGESEVDTQEMRRVVDNDLAVTIYQRIRDLAPSAGHDPKDIHSNVISDQLPSEAKNAVYNMDIFNKVSENVAQNAVKSVLDLPEIPEEGVEVTIDYNIVNIDGKQMLEVHFSDNGRGLPDPSVQRVDFTEGGTKWNKEGSGEVKGTGFGMYSLAETTRKLGGDLYLTPRNDGRRGATVVLQIPLAS